MGHFLDVTEMFGLLGRSCSQNNAIILERQVESMSLQVRRELSDLMRTYSSSTTTYPNYEWVDLGREGLTGSRIAISEGPIETEPQSLTVSVEKLVFSLTFIQGRTF